ncbi:MAG TPA: glycosyltransferase family 4 protein [Anaerolineae bacterium]
MKIGWIVPGFSSDEHDWCIPALLDLARVLAARHDLHIFALQYPYRRDRYPVFGATVHSIGGANRGRWVLPGVWRAAINEVTREHRRQRFDVLHTFWVYEPGVIAAWLKRRLGLRMVVSVAGGELAWLPAIGYGLAGQRWRLDLMRWVLRRADAVTVGSQSLLNAVRQTVPDVPAERVVLAPLGVDVEMFAGADRHGNRHQEMPVTALNVGSLEPVKAQADLIRAFRFVVDREPAAKLMLVGAGRLRNVLQSQADELRISDHVIFAGEVRREHLPELYRQAAVFVQSSVHEAQGMAVIEAAACGVPIVGTAVGALNDLAPEAALTAPPGDPLRLAQAILSVLSDPLRQRTLGSAARSRVEEMYRLDTAADRFEALYGK